MSHNNVICTICSERYRTSDNIHAGRCGHAFHEECLDRWRKQSRTCPICRCQDAAYFQLYLDFEESPGSASARGGSGSGRNRSQGQSACSHSNSNSNSSSSSSNNSSISSSDYMGIMREYENLLYETGLFQEEIKYLNQRIEALTVRNSELGNLPGESDSDVD
ncbi:E3 ubiquitin-protein ligase RNF128 [Drosophila teissieri]|uniref:E3 ubiquitin-protein ligase RNF128 n=1 Tax=Drosophila teissieri TaxID=7243 RepID=UPI001CBA3745|nr:E3 ubiquitin-protein ligase RNF128 [Drosophila teissieri]